MRFPFVSRNPARGFWRQDLSFSQEVFTPPIAFRSYEPSIREERMGSSPGLLRPGQKAPTSGIYEVHHVDHGTSHQVTVLYDDVLPHCAICGDKVRFGPVQCAVYLNAHPMLNPRI